MQKTKIGQVRQNELETLFEKMKDGDKKAREQIIIKAYPIVLYCIKNKYKGDYYMMQEYKSHGISGLIKAVDTYSLEKNTNFITYAIRCIHNEIIMYIRKCNTKTRKAERNFHKSKNIEFIMLNKIISEQNIEEEYIDKEQEKDLHNLVNGLPEREKNIIIHYFGLYGNDRKTMTEVGKIVGIDQSYISRLLPKTIRQLKHDMLELGYEGQSYKKVRTSR